MTGARSANTGHHHFFVVQTADYEQPLVAPQLGQA